MCIAVGRPRVVYRWGIRIVLMAVAAATHRPAGRRKAYTARQETQIQTTETISAPTRRVSAPKTMPCVSIDSTMPVEVAVLWSSPGLKTHPSPPSTFCA